MYPRIPLGYHNARVCQHGRQPAYSRFKKDAVATKKVEMLQYLAVRDFALIDRMEFDLGPGLNLLTGETGSGKSILIDAVAQLTGDRASLDLIRSGSEAAVIEGLFQLEPGHPALELLNDHEIPTEGGQLVIRRLISSSGSKIFVNGAMSTQRFLARLGRTLADIHGQHDQQDLLQGRAQLDFLDIFAGNQELSSEVDGCYVQLLEIGDKLEKLESSEKERAQEMEHLRYQLRELGELELRPGLDRELEEELRLLSTAQGRARNSVSAYQALYESEPSALSLLSQVEKKTLELVELDPAQAPLAERLADARLQLTDAAYQLRDYGQSIQFDQEVLEQTEARLSRLQRARRRYQRSLGELIQHRQELEDRLEGLLDHDSRKKGLEERRNTLQQAFESRASELSKRRRSAGLQLATRVEAELAELALQPCQFEVAVAPSAPSSKGVDSVQFLLSANPGEPPRPISRGASGGELSRIVLGLKSIANVDQHSKTLIFDEIDAGIGGGTASAVGLKLKAVADHHQVLCVTHLPQIAAKADQHFHVAKVQSGERTELRLLKLDREKRKRELARMLAGDQVSEMTLVQAGELLERGSTT